MKTLTAILFTAISAFSLTSCCGSKCYTNQQQELVGDEWKVVSINATEIPASEEGVPTITFDSVESKVFGYAGCNRYFGTYKLDGKTLSIENGGATKMFCPSMSIEDSFLKTIHETKSYKISKDGVLNLLNGDGKTIITAKKAVKQ